MFHLMAKLKTHKDRLGDRRVFGILLGACDSAGAHIRASIQHGFDPCGFSAAVILAESHATVHTWPEKGEVVLDYFSCSESPNFDDFIEYFLRSGFEVVDKKIVVR